MLIPMEQLIALQRITHLAPAHGGRSPSAELNIVLSNGSRVNLVCHGAALVLAREARMVAAFLDMPLLEIGPEDPSGMDPARTENPSTGA